MARESTISLSSANAGRRRVGKRGDGNVQRGRQSARRGGRGRQVGMGGGTRREDVQETIVLAYHKRRGLVTTHDDELGRETVYQDLEKTLSPHLRKERWHAIGRLDADTTGLLLMTNDGALVHHATQPGTKLPKCYLALCKGLLEEDQLDALRQGVELSGGSMCIAFYLERLASVRVIRHDPADCFQARPCYVHVRHRRARHECPRTGGACRAGSSDLLAAHNHQRRQKPPDPAHALGHWVAGDSLGAHFRRQRHRR